MKKHKRFISLVPNLIDLQGHQFIYHQSLQKKLGIPYSAYLSKKHCIKSLPKDWIPLFSLKNNRKFSPFATFKRAWDFGKLFRKRDYLPRAFFLESFNTTDLIAFTIAAKFFLKKQDSILLLFRYDLRALQVKLAQYLGATCFSDSELIIEQFAKMRIEAHLLPIPHTDIRLDKKNTTDKIICWWPGAPRPSKGKNEILALLKREKREDINIVVSQELEIHEALIPFKQISSTLTRDDYDKWLNRSDLLFSFHMIR